MKTLLSGFALGVLLSAGFGVLAQEKTDARLFAVSYAISEKCYECPTRYAIVCIDKDCTVPNKWRMEYVVFDSLDKAKRFASGKPETDFSRANDGIVRIGERPPIPTLATEIKVYELIEVKP